MITIDDPTMAALTNSGKVRVVKVAATDAPKNTELVDLLRKMTRIHEDVARVLSEPMAPAPPAPIVTVPAPIVSLSPQVTVERPSKWRFTVTKRDSTAQQRIQEIVAEIIS